MGSAKHRTSLMQTSVLLMQNLRTFAQRSPMFLFSEKNLCTEGSDRFFAAERLAYMPALVELRRETGR